MHIPFRFLSTAFGDDVHAGVPGPACGYNSPGCWTAGVPSSFSSLPPGFEHSFLIISSEGITATVSAWREAMQLFYDATATKIVDLSLTTLGYQTDNGAQLCRGCPGALDECLLGEKAYLDSIGVPIQYLSFQVRRSSLCWHSNLHSQPIALRGASS